MSTAPPPNDQLLKRFWTSIQQKDVRQAIDLCNQLTGHYPDEASTWQAACHIAQLVRQPDKALQAIERALSLEPENINWKLQHIACLIKVGESEKARQTVNMLFQDKETATTGTTANVSQLAFLCSQLEMNPQATQLYRGLIAKEPAQGGHWYNLASIQRFEGQLEKAEASLDRAIALNPQDFDAYELRAGLRRQTADNNHIKDMTDLLSKSIGMPAGEVKIRFALSKELEDMGEYSEAWQQLDKGATLRRKHINYKLQDDVITINSIQKAFSADVIGAAKSNEQNDEAIFVIGLPRTGSTLVERILGSHGDVHAAGELTNFATQMMQQVKTQYGMQQFSRPELVDKTTRLSFTDLGRSYIDSTRPSTGHSKRFTDKMPLNFLYAGLIKMALPDAKIIHVTRQPMDTCYAIFKCLFEDGYPWSYDLAEIAAYYTAYHRLMQHWTNVMPGAIHEVAYESLVTDTEAETRKMLAFCALEWDPQCLQFHQNTAPSTTASSSQVRNPVYTSSVGMWRNYQQQLEQTAETLKQQGIQSMNTTV